MTSLRLYRTITYTGEARVTVAKYDNDTDNFLGMVETITLERRR